MNICIINALDTNDARVEYLQKVFLEAGHSVIALVSDWKHIDKVKQVEARKGFRLFRAKPYYDNRSIRRIESHVDLSKKIFAYVDKHHKEIDMLWVIFPPNSFVKDAAKIKEKYPEIKLVLDTQDLWPEAVPADVLKNLWPFTFWRDLRNSHLNAADQIVTSCQLFEDNLKPTLNNTPSKTIYLARDVKQPVLADQLPKDSITLCYLGTIDSDLDLPRTREVITSIAKHKPVTLHIIGSGENLDQLVDAAKAGGAAVLYHGVIYTQEEKKQILDQCHYGLNIMKDSVIVGLTKKSLDYFACGLPVLNTVKADTWMFTEEEKLGYNIQPETDYEPIVSYDMTMRKNTADFFMKTFTYEVFKENVLSLPVFDK